MHLILRFVKSKKEFFILLLTITLSVTMLLSDAVEEKATANNLSISIFYPFQFVTTQIKNFTDLIEENQQLREENAYLSTRCGILENAAVENRRMRELIGFKDKFTFNLEAAEITARDPFIHSRHVVINVGKKDGVFPYMPVMNKDGLIGKVTSSLEGIALVQLLSAPNERVSIRTKESNEIGILENNGGREYFINFGRYADIRRGDTLITSGLGGIYPPGIYTAFVDTIVENKSDPLFKKVLVTPFVNSNKLNEVFVAKMNSRWTAFRNELSDIEIGYK